MTKLIHTRAFHRAIRILRLQKISKLVLGTLSPRFKHNGIVYRIRSPESLSIASEIFKRPTYEILLKNADIRTVIDLGCNTGFFTCLMNNHRDGNGLKAVLVDADEDVLKECNWHMQENGIDNCQVICAVVGPKERETSDFYLSEFNISSSAKPFDDNYPFPLKSTKKILLPVVTLENLIRLYFADDRVSVLKVDIEGSEAELLEQDLTCLGNVDWLVLEWHKWVIQLEDVKAKLSNHRFELIDVVKEDSICGVSIFRNTKISTSRIQR